MRSYLLILFALLQINLKAQITFLYIDAGSFSNKDNLISELKKNEKLNVGTFISFISYDRNPLINFKNADFIHGLDRIKDIKPSAPITFFEVDTLNYLFNTFDLISEKVYLHFYTDYYQARNSVIPYLLERFLLCNDLIDKNGIHKNVKVIFHLKPIQHQKQELIKQLLNNSNYEVYFF